MVVELYAPKNGEKSQGFEDVTFADGGDIIYRPAIPCIIGKDTVVSHIKTAKFSYLNYLSLYLVDEKKY